MIDRNGSNRIPMLRLVLVQKEGEGSIVYGKTTSIELLNKNRAASLLLLSTKKLLVPKYTLFTPCLSLLPAVLVQTTNATGTMEVANASARYP